MTCGIYAISHVISGKAYIGSSNNVETRWLRQRSQLVNGKHVNKPLLNAWRKYGGRRFLV